VIAVDWSGRATGEERHLFMAEITDGAVPGALQGRTRAAVERRLLDLADNDPNIVCGLDFGFSLPAWFLSQQGIDQVDEMWSDSDRLERWLAACEPPFWGRPGRPRPSDAGERGWRATELAAAAAGPRPKAVFQIGGAGAVGTGSLRGMPMLGRLRRAGFSVWPFDPPRPPVLLEVWPRHHYGGPLVKSNLAARTLAAARLPEQWRATAAHSEDAFDAGITAWGLWTQTDAIVTAAPVDHPLAPVEGWIWGVAVPSR
jgi:hypothetical protein